MFYNFTDHFLNFFLTSNWLVLIRNLLGFGYPLKTIVSYNSFRSVEIKYLKNNF